MISLETNTIFDNFDILISKGLFVEANKFLEKMNLNNLSEEEKNQYHVLKGMVLYELGDFKESTNFLSYDFSENFISGSKFLFYKGLIYKAMSMVRISQLSDAIDYLNILLPEIIEFKNLDLEALIYNWLGNAYWLNGNLQEALNYHEMALKIRKRNGNTVEIATSLNNLALIYRVQGKLKKSVEIYDEILSFNMNTLKGNSIALSNRGMAYYELGELDRALQDQVKGYNLRVNSGSKYLISDSIFNIIRIAYSLKNVNLLQEYIKKFDSIKEVPSIATIKIMANAYIKMLEKPVGSIEDWKLAVMDQNLEFGYKLIAYEEILNIYSKKDHFNFSQVMELLDNFEKLAKENNIYAILPKINFVRALIFKSLFELDKTKYYLNETIAISRNHGLPYHENLAKRELEDITNHMDKFNEIYKNKEEDSDDFQSKEIVSYIQNFKLILSEAFET